MSRIGRPLPTKPTLTGAYKYWPARSCVVADPPHDEPVSARPFHRMLARRHFRTEMLPTVCRRFGLSNRRSVGVRGHYR